MNSLFGDATSVMPTPETLAEAESLFSSTRSPVPSLDIRQQSGLTADHAIPGLDIDPPAEVSSEAIQRGSATARPNIGGRTASGGSRGEGVGGWITSMIARSRGQDENKGDYQSVGQDERE